MRVGFGFDAHAIDPARELVLGGVRFPDVSGLAGHSDGDVVAHAVADALLGAAALGDIGEHFPSDPQWVDADSMQILALVASKLLDAGWEVENVDVSVVANAPKISPVREEMVDALAAALGADGRRVSVKATTTDGLGFTGRGEGIAAFAVASVRPADTAH